MNKILLIMSFILFFIVGWLSSETYLSPNSSTGVGSDFIQSAHGQAVPEDEGDILDFMPAILAAAVRQNPPVEKCINKTGAVGTLKQHTIPIAQVGRLAIGDLNGDHSPDYVVSNRGRIRAYNVCGVKLWDKAADINWDNHSVGSGATEASHVYWNWSSMGYVGDVDGGASEFVHIGQDFRTLYVRDGKTGNIKYQRTMRPGKWLYVLVSNDKRIFAAEEPGDLNVSTYYVSSTGIQPSWWNDQGYILNKYESPMIADINGDGYQDIVHSSLGLDGKTGSVLFKHNFTGYGIIGSQTMTIADLNPSTAGLETIWSVYAPRNSGQPSIVVSDKDGGKKLNYHSGIHAHQHTIGNFDPNSHGLEIFARSNDGKSHWLINKNGTTLANNVRRNPRSLNSSWGLDWGDEGGEIIQGIEWDEHIGTEVLYVERHMDFRGIPLLAITNSAASAFLTSAFGGGNDNDPLLKVKCTNCWFGWSNRTSDPQDDGPYEGDAHVVDVFGDGREEVIQIVPGAIKIFYNSGDAGVKRRWLDPKYQTRKKSWVQVYGPR